ncbi:MAG TPA: hypothetical protein VLN72_00760, partial [Gillisia sp.]|nr:hypothetical protein [Gillisia sp.]
SSTSSLEHPAIKSTSANAKANAGAKCNFLKCIYFSLGIVTGMGPVVKKFSRLKGELKDNSMCYINPTFGNCLTIKIEGFSRLVLNYVNPRKQRD